ncbi:MAG: cupin domain-containing protein [Thermoanaerobaculia bacterium]
MPDLFTPRPVTRVDKPWGYELLFARTDAYVGKIIHVNAGESLSLQYHVQKEETLYLVTGLVRLTLGRDGREEVKEMKPGEAYHIPPGLIHRIEAVVDADIAEVSTTQLDDVVRLEDRYGRKGTSAP